MNERHIVMFSGGIGSYLAAKRVIQEHGTEHVTLLFADTLQEDQDLYRFLDDAASCLGVPVTRIAEGRTPWQVFKDARFLGNSRVDLCSKALKRDPCYRWLEENCEPGACRIYVGIDWSESHRYEKIRDRNKVWRYYAPLCEPPYLSPAQAKQAVIDDGIRIPRLYTEGFAHNNCGGFCVKAGQAHFANLLEKRPDAYAYHEQKEEEMRALIGKNVSIMTDRRNKQRVPMTLKQFRERKQEGMAHDEHEFGGCGCFAGEL